MYKRHLILFGIIISVSLLLIAILLYPGGSEANLNAVGFDWKNNYLSNLFTPLAIDSTPNTSRIWAIIGWFFFCISVAIFFIDFSVKIGVKGPATIIRSCGTIAMVFAFLAITPNHDTVIGIAGALALVSLFYITIFIFKTKRALLKLLCIIGLILLYSIDYIYYTQHYIRLLPIVQKLSLLVGIILILSLRYGTNRDDFSPNHRKHV